ncbi:MAG: hypothetical protein NTY14_04525 [Candidatus Omnitrophica bacterium]|nr:hypothetical protein [Candidatus Omnitrophota bacterium]
MTGEWFYNNSSDSLEVYTNSGWVNLTGGGGGGSWSTYRGNHIVNSNPGFVGIGLNASSLAGLPEAPLSVMSQGRSTDGRSTRIAQFGSHNLDTGHFGFLSVYIYPEETPGVYLNRTVNIYTPEEECFGSQNLLISAAHENGTIRFGVDSRNAGSEVMRLMKDSATGQRRVGIGTQNPQQKLEVNGTMRLTPSAAPPGAPPAGSMYYDSAQDTPRYRDATAPAQWGNFISEYGAVNLPAGQSYVTVPFRKTYTTPPIVIPVGTQKGILGADWIVTVFNFEVTKTYVKFDVDCADSSNNFKDECAEDVEIQYIVIPRP